MIGIKTAFLSLLLLSSFAMLAEDGPPIDVEVYFSKDDPHLAEAEKKIAAVNKRFPRLRITRISYDDDAGYKKLAEREKELGIKDAGDLLILMGPISLVSKGDARNAENGFEAVVDRALNPGAGKGRLPSTPANYARAQFGKEAETVPLAELDNGEVKLFKVMKDGKLAGYEVDAYIPIKCPMCNDTQFQFTTDAQFKITAIQAIREMELYGTPIPEARTTAFLKQFIGRVPTNAPAEVDGIAGATKTVSSYENAVVTILNELKERAAQ